MIKQGIKNFFINLKYFFTPLGTIALGFVFGLSIAIPGIISSISALADDVKTILGDATVDFAVLKDSLFAEVKGLNWRDPFDALGSMLSVDWITNTINSCAKAFVEDIEIYTSPINDAVVVFMNDIVTYVTVIITFIVLGLIGGYVLVKWLVRRNMAKRSVWKYFLNSFIDSLLTATLVVFCVWLISIWKPSIFITTFLSIILFGFISLFEAYVVHGLKKVKIKEVVNGKNILKLFATNLLILLSAAILTGLAVILTNMIVGIFMGVAFIETAFIVIGFNAEAYVKSVAEAKQDKE